MSQALVGKLETGADILFVTLPSANVPVFISMVKIGFDIAATLKYPKGNVSGVTEVLVVQVALLCGTPEELSLKEHIPLPSVCFALTFSIFLFLVAG